MPIRERYNFDLSYVYEPCRCGCGAEAMNYELGVLPRHRQRWIAMLREQARQGDQTSFNMLYKLGAPMEKPIMTGFGFEAEFFGLYQSDAVELMNSAGFTTKDDGYHHDKRPYWRVTEDGSVTCDPEGLELVSPVLGTNQVSLTQAKGAVTALGSGGAMVNTSCGLHVHHSAHRMQLPDFIELLGAYAVWGNTINTILPASRRGDCQWSRQLHSTFSGIQSYVSALTRRWGQSGYDGIAGLYDRYMAINLQALVVHGTVEFRQHSGTLNAEKLEHWVRLTRLFTRSKRNGNDIFKYLDEYDHDIAAATEGGVAAMCDYLGTTQATKKFYLDRAKQFSVDVQDDEDVGGGDEPEEWYCDECDEYHTSEDHY